MTDETVQAEELNTEVEEEVKTGEVPEVDEAHEDETPEQKQSRSQNAKQRLKRKLREEQEAKQALLEKTQSLEERLAELDKKLTGVLNPPKPRPNRYDFDSQEDYEDSLLDWKLSQKTPEFKPEEVKKPAEKPNQRQVDPEIVKKWTKQVASAIEKYEDFEEVAYSAPLSDVTADLIAENDLGAEIAYFLGNNPEEAERISSLSLARQVREIDKLQVQLTKPRTTNAPDPINPAKGSDVPTKDPKKMSDKEYAEFRRKQMAG